jgi:hypothetical protein
MDTPGSYAHATPSITGDYMREAPHLGYVRVNGAAYRTGLSGEIWVGIEKIPYPLLLENMAPRATTACTDLRITGDML